VAVGALLYDRQSILLHGYAQRPSDDIISQELGVFLDHRRLRKLSNISTRALRSILRERLDDSESFLCAGRIPAAVILAAMSRSAPHISNRHATTRNAPRNLGDWATGSDAQALDDSC
jgi:hypothetical protein